MSSPYVGEIRLFAGNFAPAGWMFCNGALLPISEYETLFNLIGTTYGGDGQSNFSLPNLQGRVPVHQGNGGVIGQMGGTESVTLTTNQIPAHSHVLRASGSAATVSSPAGAVLAGTTVNTFGPGPAQSAMAAQAISAVGGSQPHDNMPPFLALNYIISLFGIFPSQS